LLSTSDSALNDCDERLNSLPQTNKCNKAKTPCLHVQKEQELSAFKTVERWLATLHNDVTKHQYIENLWRYGTDTQMTPDQLIEEKAKSIQDPNLRGLAEDRLIQWHNGYERKAPGVAISVFKAVKSFFKANYLPLGAKIPAYTMQREEEYIPTREEVKAMCELADLETAMFILFTAESGQRDGTVADLNRSHVQGCLGSEPYVFIIPQKRDAKTGKIVKSKRIYGRYGFLCKDAV
jgi:hypothetical protein